MPRQYPKEFKAEAVRLSQQDGVTCAQVAADLGIPVKTLYRWRSEAELMKDLDRPRGDMWEVALWEDILTVEGDQAYYTYQVDNQAIVIPETIDAIRALTEAVADGAESIARTNEAMGIRKNFLED